MGRLAGQSMQKLAAENHHKLFWMDFNWGDFMSVFFYFARMKVLPLPPQGKARAVGGEISCPEKTQS